MKKEKKVRTYQRRTKSGKLVTVKAHTAKYDAAERAKELAKKKGAGDELEERKKKKTLSEGYPENYEWIKDIPDEDMGWFTDVVATATDNTETYDQKSRKALAKFFSDDMGPKMGVKEKHRYLAAKKLGVKSEEEYMRKFDEIEALSKKMKPTKTSVEVEGAIKKSKPKKSDDKVTKEEKPSAKAKTESKPKKVEASEPAFTAAEFKEWYQGTGSAADKKVAKALRAQLGRAGYKKLEDEAIDNYTPRGHLSMFKRVNAPTTDTATKAPSKKAAKPAETSTSSIGAKATPKKTTKESKRDARWDRGEFTNEEKEVAKIVFALSGKKNNLHPKLNAWVQAEYKKYAKSDKEKGSKVMSKEAETVPKTKTSKPKESNKKPQAKSVKKSTKRMTPKETAEFVQKSDWIYGE